MPKATAQIRHIFCCLILYHMMYELIILASLFSILSKTSCFEKIAQNEVYDKINFPLVAHFSMKLLSLICKLV